MDPRSVNLIFSSFKKDIRSINHTFAEGGDAAFHCKSILLRAIKEANAITLSCFLVRTTSSSGIPKIAMWGHGTIVVSNTSEIMSKKDFQNVINFGQDQNMWDRSPGDCEHLSQLSVTPGYILDNLALL